MRLFTLALQRGLILLFLVCFNQYIVMAQTSKEEIFKTLEKSGGVNYAYPDSSSATLTPPPPGYHSFYISHFGRHGSRYLVEDSEYKKVLDIFQQADSVHTLSPLGKTVYQKLQLIWEAAKGHGGSLTPLGISQLRNIARRMYLHYKDVFMDGAQVTAVSTTSGRCIHSMNLFCEQLKELNTKLEIQQDADSRHMKYLNYHTDRAVAFRYAPDGWRVAYAQFEREHIQPERLIKTLFADGGYANAHINAATLMWNLYDIASNLQNMQSPVSLYPIFTKDELFNLWQCRNYSLYVQYANAAVNQCMMMENAKPLLKDIIEKANSVIANQENGASFRFGHDGNIIPLAMLLHLENSYGSIPDPEQYYKVWSDFKVAPMAANIQIVFFQKSGSKDVLVKFLQNEHEVLVPPVKCHQPPYYLWRDVLAYYQSLL
ncbi:histidine phosphatase family protein [Niabella sp.]|uniref:histidine phosphatase family protein n=1 Tax=Niabella sp. TaxID=1962976 RepID=UPI00260A76B0|nr:histidine phosphatase family protein [Niabella sp.]